MFNVLEHCEMSEAKSPCESVHVLAFFSFASGLFFGPLSLGLYYYLIFIIIYEIIFLIVCAEYNPFVRIYFAIVGTIGWIIGRLAYRYGIINT